MSPRIVKSKANTKLEVPSQGSDKIRAKKQSDKSANLPHHSSMMQPESQQEQVQQHQDQNSLLSCTQVTLQTTSVDSVPASSFSIDSDVMDEAAAAPTVQQKQRERLLQEVATLPNLPGVYRYFDEQNQLLYVGKANDLKKRVSSYFQKDHGGTRIGHMVSKIVRLETTVVRSEAEALLLENNLIKTLGPKYNILFRDDKSYPYLRLTGVAGLQLKKTNPSKSKNKNNQNVLSSETSASSDAAVVQNQPQRQQVETSKYIAADYARLAYYRGAVNRNDLFFGPYPSAWAVKETILLLQKAFLLRTCEDTVFVNRSRPCLLYQIKRCSGPCVGKISASSYLQDVQNAAAFLQGDADQVLEQMQNQMMSHAEALEFELAAQLRNKMAALSKIMHEQSIETLSDRDIDVIAVVLQGGKACVNLAMVRGGRHLGDRPFFPSQVDGGLLMALAHQDENQTPESANTAGAPAPTSIFTSTVVLDSNAQAESDVHHSASSIDASDIIATWSHAEWIQKFSAQQHQNHPSFTLEKQVLEAFIAQHYQDIPLPDKIITSVAVAQELQQALSEHAGRKIQWLHQPREQQKIWLEMALQNAQIQLAKLLSEEGSQQARTEALIEALDLAVESPEHFRVECFDISHTSGEATQASCVVYESHQMQSAQYRRYNIEGITGGDDYAAMKQVLLRRYGKLVEAVKLGEAKFPDLVLVDGGKGQISMAKEVFETLGLDLSLLAGVEKGEGRKVGLEELVFADGRPKVYLGANSAALMLIAQIRDEAHRFAITGMRAKRAKTRVGGSRLEDIAGIGPKRRAALLQRFGGVKGVASASIDDLSKVEGISLELAEKIYAALR